VYYELAGAPDATVVVCSASLGTELSIWSPQADRLASSHRVLRYDLRGHGRSPVPPGPYAIADLGGDLIAALDRLEIQRATLCGISIGAMTSIWTAAHRSDRVDGLILCCTSARFDEEARRAYVDRAAAVRAGGLEPIADAVISRWLTHRFARANPAVLARLRSGLVSIPPEGYAGGCEALAAMDLRPELDAVEVPTLVIAGEEDAATPPADGRLIADRIRGARLELVPTAHLAIVEQPTRVGDLILNFLQEQCNG
jgi:3-oxoadipate enol-lactonase